MNEIQEKINKMHQGEVDEIIKGAMTDTEILILNAMITGAIHRIGDPQFLHRVTEIEKSDATLLGVHLNDVATATLHILGAKTYTGTSPVVQSMIKYVFGYGDSLKDKS